MIFAILCKSKIRFWICIKLKPEPFIFYLIPVHRLSSTFYRSKCTSPFLNTSTTTPSQFLTCIRTQ